MATKNPKAVSEAAAATPETTAEQGVEVERQQQDANQAEQAPATAGAVPEVNIAGQQDDDVERRDVRVLAPVTIAGVSYGPNDVIEGLPLALVEAYAGSVDDHPDAVDYAHSIGAPVKQFELLAE